MDLSLLVTFFQNYGYAAVFGVLLVCGFGVPIPEDISLVAGGVISGLGYTDVHTMFAVGMAGVLIGDGIMFMAGRIFGERILKVRYVARIVTPERYDAVQKNFEKYGGWVLFMARFMPGLRSPVFVIAGATRRVSFLRFLCTDGLAALISVPIWVYMGYYGASNLDTLHRWIRNGQIGILSIVGAVIFVVLFVWWKRRSKHKREVL